MSNVLWGIVWGYTSVKMMFFLICESVLHLEVIFQFGSVVTSSGQRRGVLKSKKAPVGFR